ncbi:hypothetical protein Bca4012_065163 [Brassica carinata]
MRRVSFPREEAHTQKRTTAEPVENHSKMLSSETAVPASLQVDPQRMQLLPWLLGRRSSPNPGWILIQVLPRRRLRDHCLKKIVRSGAEMMNLRREEKINQKIFADLGLWGNENRGRKLESLLTIVFLWNDSDGSVETVADALNPNPTYSLRKLEEQIQIPLDKYGVGDGGNGGSVEASALPTIVAPFFVAASKLKFNNKSLEASSRKSRLEAKGGGLGLQAEEDGEMMTREGELVEETNSYCTQFVFILQIHGIVSTSHLY